MKCAVSVRLALATLAALLMIWPAGAWAQSLTSGDITGTVTDPSGAAVPNANVTLKSNDTGQTRSTTSNSTGGYRFALLSPGSYTVSSASQGFQASNQNVNVAVGQTTTVNISMQVATASQTVEVTAQGSAIQTDNGNVSTTLSPEIIANMPNPGNDLSFYVQTAPGATMNTQAGYGNSSTFGISATSNLFTVDGMNENDPFLNLNNSGATNLMLGANDVSTATVVNNGYSGEYGTLAGANVNYVTKAGSNKFHGNAEYFWNGRVLNANDWFLNNSGAPRPFDNANQWAASAGGPIKKDKTFFFLDTEGLRLLIPTSQPVFIPSPQFQTATLSSIPASEVPFYTSLFTLYNNAPGASRAVNTLPGGGCDGSVTLAGGAPCALQFQSNINNLTTEWLLTARVDQNISNTDRVFVHFRTDHGLQATITDPINRALNAQSVQPQYEGQLQESHQVGANGINQFILAGAWYSAVFGPPNLAQAISLMPYQMTLTNGAFSTPGSTFYSSWPQGRNVTQYQLEDDYSWQRGRHNMKFGVNFRRNDITDYTPGGFNTAIPTANFSTQSSFLAGTADSFVQGFATRPTEPLALYSLGLYAQDEWALRPTLKVTLSLRAEHNSDPVCATNCFARLDNSFTSISHDPSQPYNQAIQTGLHQALPGYQSLAWEPRFGFAWQPLGQGKTVIRGGIGIFADVFPGDTATLFDTNSPLKNTFVVPGGTSASTFIPIAPNVAGNAQSVASASNTAFVNGFNAGQNLAQITASLPATVAFTPPSLVNSERHIQYPTYYEWNLEVQQALGNRSSLSINYVGNHGSDLAGTNGGVNGYCDALCLSTLGSITTTGAPLASFIGLPSAVPDARFSTVTEVGNPGISNYNGLVVSLTHRVSANFQAQLSYTWSHAMDDISNGGFLPFNFSTNTSILAAQNPANWKQYNYGNADYDVRHQANLTWSYHTPRLNNKALDLLADWTISGFFFARTGLPFTVIDGTATGVLSSFNYGPLLGMDLFANDSVGPISCGRASVANAAGTPLQCPSAADFTSAVGPGGIGTFGAQRRNQIYGPSYLDTDLTLMKNFRIPKWEGAELQIGAQAFNILNHPNFDQPVGDIANQQFGLINRTVATPTSIFGSFLGANASPRALQIRAQLRF
ncbi:MAG TPA: carboxypeptidase regulatory-like domain-containing protein [Candidatus Sulfotelmatobacter sp.]|nr:carboxypeptidase regulatory-like domain-containing protein [Candidatus Sulfotelmatobacter sp.]